MTCLDADTVLAFLDGQLAGARAAEIEEHLDSCAACRRMVSEAAADGVAAGDDLRGMPERVGWYDVSGPLGGQDDSRERYRAHDPRRARDVCLELFRGDDGPMSPDEADRLEKALRPAAGVAHPNLVAVLDVGIHDGAVYAVTELVEGDSLAAILAGRKPVELEQALGWLRGIARGLAAAHDRGLAHGRLTPADVIIQSSDERARVAEVAIARLAGATSAPPYRAPELMDPGAAPRRHDDVVRRDARVDVYAWGVLAHALVGGDPRVLERLVDRTVARDEPRPKGASRPPPDDDSSGSSRSRSSASGARAQLEISERVPEAFAHVIRRALWRAPAARFANARELAFVLETLDLVAAGRASSTVRAPDRDVPTVPEAMPAAAVTTAAGARPPSKRWLWLAASLLVVGAAALSWVLLRKRDATAAAPAPAAAREPPAISRLLARSGHVVAARQAPNGLYVSIILGEGYGTSGFYNTAVHKRTLDGLEEVPGTTGAVLVAAGKDRLAVLRDPKFDGELTHGTIELIDASGAVQKLEGDRNDIVAADLSSAGLAVVRLRDEVARVEVPLGSVVYQAPSRVWSLRANPRGRLAWVERANGRVRIATLVRGEAPVVHADDGLWRTVMMVAWHGERLLVAGGRGTVEHGLWMIEGTKPPQLLWTSPQTLALFDVTADRELVVGLYDYANHIWAHPAGASRDREVAWSDRSMLAGISLDGRHLVTMEAPITFGDPGAIHVRSLDGAETIPVGRGYGGPLSADGRWIVMRSASSPAHPIATSLARTPWDRGGDQRDVRHLPAGDITAYQRASWHGERIVMLARGTRGDAVYTQDLDGPPQRLGPWTGHAQRGLFLVSPDGKYIADVDRDGTPALFELATLSVTRLSHPGVIVGWSADSQAVFVCELRWPIVVGRVPIARPAEVEPHLVIEAPGPDLMPPTDLRIAGDGRTYAYSAQALRSTLYRLQGALPDDQAP